MMPKNIFLSLIIFLCVISELPAQNGRIYKAGKKDPYRLLNSKWVFYPKVHPYYPLVTYFKDVENNDINVQRDNGIIAGITFEKFYPNRKISYKLDIDYLSRDLFVMGTPAFYLSENNIGIGKIIQLKKNSLEKEKIPLFEFGIRTQYTLSSVLMATGQDVNVELDNSDLLRKFRWYGYLGVGRQNILSNIELGNSRYIGLKHFSVGLYFPLFNQANLFKNNLSDYDEPFSTFFKSSYYPLFLSVSYTHALDIKKNDVKYSIPAEVYGNCSKAKNPFVNFGNPKKNTFGNFYFHALIQPRVDSVFVDFGANERIITSISPAPISYRLGYTVHFLGNYNKYINFQTCQEYNVNTSDYRRFRFNFFAGTGLSNRTFFIENGLSRVNYLDLEATGGLRLGIHPLGIFVFGGYAYQINLNKNLALKEKNFDEFNFSDYSNRYLFGGVSFKNALSFYVNYHMGVSSLKVAPRTIDKITFSIGVGI